MNLKQISIQWKDCWHLQNSSGRDFLLQYFNIYLLTIASLYVEKPHLKVLEITFNK